MDIILNEKAKALEIIRTGKVYKNIWETKAILIKYYKSKGMNNAKIRYKLEKFLKNNIKTISNGKEYNIVKDAENIEKAIKMFTKPDVKLNKLKNIKVSKNELEKIKSIRNLPLEKLAFILLILCKVNNIKNNKFSEWVNDKTKNFYKHSQNRGGVEYQELMIGKLFKLGLIDLPNERVPNGTGIKLLYIDETIHKNDVEIEISDLREVVLYYLKWIGEKVINCEQCNVLTLQKSNNNKYCPTCWKEKEKEDNRRYARESMRKIRNNS